MNVFAPGQDTTIRILASIWPMRLTESRPLYSGNFTMAPVPKDGHPEILIIDHHQQFEQEPITHRQRPQTIFSVEIANDLMRCWSNGGLFMDDSAGPGVWILQLPDGRYPDPNNPAEIKAAIEFGVQHQRERQGLYLGRLIESGDVKAADENQRKGITALEKMAATYMGYEREWLHDIKHGDRKPCQFCQKSLPSTAVKCSFCGEIVDAVTYARIEAERNAEMEKVRQQYASSLTAADEGKKMPPPVKIPEKAGARA